MNGFQAEDHQRSWDGALRSHFLGFLDALSVTAVTWFYRSQR